MARRLTAGQAKRLGPHAGDNDAAPKLRPRIEVRAYATLKPAGGSLVMTVPAAIRKALSYSAGTELAVTVEGSKMVIEAVEPRVVTTRVRPPKYTLHQLLAASNPDVPMSDEERAWQDAAPVGRETW